MKRLFDYLIIVLLIAIFASTLIIQHKLDVVRETIEDDKTPKLEISNLNQFTQLCNQFTSQWSADGYAFYLLQPKSPSKTHKEKASSSINYAKLPVRVNLTDDENNKKLITNKFIEGDNKLANKLLNSQNIDCKRFILIPIYQNDIIIGELYLFYNNDLKDSSIQTKISEAQLLGKLLN